MANNEIIKIYDPLFPENYQIVSIDTVDSTTQITLNEEITQANLDAAGLRIDKVVLQNVAFNNTNNFNIVRYYDENGTPYDTYSTVAIKIVLLAENSYVVPRVDDYRVIGVSA